MLINLWFPIAELFNIHKWAADFKSSPKRIFVESEDMIWNCGVNQMELERQMWLRTRCHLFLMKETGELKPESLSDVWSIDL